MQEEPTRTQSASSRTEPYPPWDPVFAYNNLPPVPRERLTTPAVEARCEIATSALNTLREATARNSDPVTLMQTLALPGVEPFREVVAGAPPGQLDPHVGQHLVFLDASAVDVEIAQAGLGRRIALLGRLPVPARRLRVVARDTTVAEVEQSQVVLCGRIALIGGE